MCVCVCVCENGCLTSSNLYFVLYFINPAITIYSHACLSVMKIFLHWLFILYYNLNFFSLFIRNGASFQSCCCALSSRPFLCVFFPTSFVLAFTCVCCSVAKPDPPPMARSRLNTGGWQIFDCILFVQSISCCDAGFICSYAGFFLSLVYRWLEASVIVLQNHTVYLCSSSFQVVYCQYLCGVLSKVYFTTIWIPYNIVKR